MAGPNKKLYKNKKIIKKIKYKFYKQKKMT